MNITIDGPGGSGKSTLAKRIAKTLGITYLDTGAMYRAVGFYVVEKGIDPSDIDSVLAVLDDINLDIKYIDGEQSVFIGDRNVTPYIRRNDISMAASTVSKIPQVRLKLVELQRIIAKKTDCVMDGRDCGSYILPNAEYKFYVDASLDVRAQRRFLELQGRGQNIPYAEIEEEMRKRDLQDMGRAFAPLVIPEGAIVLDSTNLSADEVERFVLQNIQEKQ